jgi:hypothetical protein
MGPVAHNPELARFGTRELLEELGHRFGFAEGAAGKAQGRLAVEYSDGFVRWIDEGRIRVPASELDRYDPKAEVDEL